LVAVGFIYNSTLTGGIRKNITVPFIYMTSVAIPGYYYWAKYLLTSSQMLYRVKFSTDGKLLITTSLDYIIIFNST